jgi:bifunctional non-homologous end joining protein LigD
MLQIFPTQRSDKTGELGVVATGVLWLDLLKRTGIDWTEKYPGAVAALANLNVKTAYIDGELCDDAGLPSFAETQAATHGERGVHLVYYAFDLLHVGGWDVSHLQLTERKALLEPLVSNKPDLQFNGHEAGDGELKARRPTWA